MELRAKVKSLMMKQERKPMMEVFTISGPPVELLGDPVSDLFQKRLKEMRTQQGLDYTPGPRDAVCAQAVKGTFVVGTGAVFSSVPVGLFGVYKTLKSGNRAVGIVSLLSAGILWGVGRVLLKNAATRFVACGKAA